MKRIVVIIMAVLALGAISATVGAAQAHASDCSGSTLASVRKCFNTRVAAQHLQIVSLQKQVKGLSKITTVTGLSKAITAIQQVNAQQTTDIQWVTQRTDCFGNGVNFSEYTTPSWGSPSPAGGYPYGGPSTQTFLDLFHSSQPANQQVYRMITYQC